MAKRNEEKLNYPLEVRKLKENGPRPLYLLWGAEDYLRECYLDELKKLCLPDGEDSFCFKRLNGPELDARELRQAIDAIPFLSERSLVELRGVDINRLQDGETIQKILDDIPEYCTVVFVQNVDFDPDGRSKLTKAIRSRGVDLCFTSQTQNSLINWISRRFGALGKGIEMEAAQRLIFVSGDLMNRLIPEIEKVAAYAKGDKVTVSDVEAVANHIPEAVIFKMTDLISQRQFNSAFTVLSELMLGRDSDPIGMIAMLGIQMRRLYAAKLASQQGLGIRYVMETCGIKYDYQASRLMQSARGFTLPQLRKAVELCAEADYRMKSSSQDDLALFKDVVLQIAAGEKDAQR